jgi:hypothetical protein
MRGVLIGLAVSVVALAGCSKPADNTAANATNAAAATPAAATPAATPAAPAAAAGPAGPISVAELPAPTAGQWSRSSSQDGAAAEPGTKCMDGKPIDPTDGVMKCPKMDATRTATGGFVVIADCTGGGPGGMSAKLSLAGEGDFTKSFTTDATMTMTGGPGGAMTTKNHSVYTYVGPTCTK